MRVEKTMFTSWLCNQALLLSSPAFSGTQSTPSFVHSFFLARPTDAASQETGRWETNHFIGMALNVLTAGSLELNVSDEGQFL